MSTTTFFYDGQIRRYLLQVIRLLSNFAVKHSDGTLVRVPVMYGDPDRQAASVINQNSENSVLSAPRIAVYITDLELDVSRMSDSTFVSKVHIRERDYNSTLQQYDLNANKSYTVERLMPTPYKLTLKVDIWSTSTDQKLQILEQLLMLFNPSLEIQTTDNYLDWTSLSVVDLLQTSFSSRSIPVGTSDSIDVATLTLQTPIWISPPAKVKKLGIITRVISSIYADISSPYGNYVEGLGVDPEANSVAPVGPIVSQVDTSSRHSIEVIGNTVQLLLNDTEKEVTWQTAVAPSYEIKPGLSRIVLKTPTNLVVGLVSVNPINPRQLSVNWDVDTYPSNTQIPSLVRPRLGTFDAIIDPKKVGPVNLTLPVLETGRRFLIVDNIGSGIIESFIVEDAAVQYIKTSALASNVVDYRVFVDTVEVGATSKVDASGNYIIVLDEAAVNSSEVKITLYTNQDGPDAWKNADGSDFIAEENDIIEWDGSQWAVVFKATDHSDQILCLTNILTNTQYMWNGVYWKKTFEGVYRPGEWYLEV